MSWSVFLDHLTGVGGHLARLPEEDLERRFLKPNHGVWDPNNPDDLPDLKFLKVRDKGDEKWVDFDPRVKDKLGNCPQLKSAVLAKQICLPSTVPPTPQNADSVVYSWEGLKNSLQAEEGMQYVPKRAFQQLTNDLNRKANFSFLFRLLVWLAHNCDEFGSAFASEVLLEESWVSGTSALNSHVLNKQEVEQNQLAPFRFLVSVPVSKLTVKQRTFRFEFDAPCYALHPELAEALKSRKINVFDSFRSLGYKVVEEHSATALQPLDRGSPAFQLPANEVLKMLESITEQHFENLEMVTSTLEDLGETNKWHSSASLLRKAMQRAGRQEDTNSFDKELRRRNNMLPRTLEIIGNFVKTDSSLPTAVSDSESSQRPVVLCRLKKRGQGAKAFELSLSYPGTNSFHSSSSSSSSSSQVTSSSSSVSPPSSSSTTRGTKRVRSEACTEPKKSSALKQIKFDSSSSSSSQVMSSSSVSPPSSPSTNGTTSSGF